mgnify:CR=1 FL=1
MRVKVDACDLGWVLEGVLESCDCGHADANDIVDANDCVACAAKRLIGQLREQVSRRERAARAGMPLPGRTRPRTSAA